MPRVTGVVCFGVFNRKLHSLQSRAGSTTHAAHCRHADASRVLSQTGSFRFRRTSHLSSSGGVRWLESMAGVCARVRTAEKGSNTTPVTSCTSAALTITEVRVDTLATGATDRAAAGALRAVLLTLAQGWRQMNMMADFDTDKPRSK